MMAYTDIPLIEDVPGYSAEYSDQNDSVPGDVIGIEYPCVTCGKEAGPYSGRGRKPKYCQECKLNKGGSRSTGAKTTTGKNKVLAASAADTLAQYNGILALGCMLTPYAETGIAITNANETFREQAYNALLTDPKLAAQISNGGTISGPALLVIAYLSMIGAVAPVAVMEYKANKANKELAEKG